MKLSLILNTLAAARLPSVTSEQLQQLVGTTEGKAFADDLKWYAAGDIDRREHLAAVVNVLAPGMRRTVTQLGFHFDLVRLITVIKRDGAKGINTIRTANENPGNRARAFAYLQGAGLNMASTEAALAPTARTDPPYYSFKIFGAAAALCVCEARTRSGNQCTIQIEGAQLASTGGHKQFDWQNKIIVQLTVQEAYLTLALFENLIPSVKFDGHGRTHDKSLLIEFQESHYFVRLIQRGRAAVAVQVRAVDAVQVVALLYKQLLTNEPHLGIEDLRAMVKRIATMMSVSR